MTVKIWHKVRHDDANVSEIDAPLYFGAFVRQIRKNEGIQIGHTFVPWHSITWIESEGETT